MSAKTSRSMSLQPTGRMSVIFEVEDYGPIEMRVEDLETVLSVIRVLLGSSDAGTMTVNSYGKRAQARLEKVLQGAS